MNSNARCLVVAIPILLGSAGDVAAQSCHVTMAQLKKMNVCELDRLFEHAAPGGIPHGFARGQVLLMVDAKFPKMRARFASSAWKGKHFEDDGEFINQWPGFQALRGKSQLGTSWHDEKPCWVLDYPPGTPLFGNTRDEMRQIGCGLFLARLYETCPCPRFRGYFAIQVCAACP